MSALPAHLLDNITLTRAHAREERTEYNREALKLLAKQAVLGLPSAHSRRAYVSQLTKFFATGRSLTREDLQEHLAELRDAGKGPSTLHVARAAILCLAEEARVRYLLPEHLAASMRAVESPHSLGSSTGHWLTLAATRTLLRLPDRSTLIGKRDAALLGTLVGCLLRRSEAASLTWSHFEEHHGRWILRNIRGKGNRIRTVPVPDWAARDLLAWREALWSIEGEPKPDSPPWQLHAFRRIDGAQARWHPTEQPILPKPLTVSGIWWIVCQYATKLGIDIRPHDLRRTAAQLMRDRAVPLEQIQFTLGHASLVTTEAYLSGKLELSPGLAGVDKTGIEGETE